MQLRELLPDELPDIYPLVHELNQPMNPAFDRPRFDQLLAHMRTTGYRCLGAFDEGKLVAVCGFTIFTRLWCGRQLDLDNFIVTESCRGQKVGERMLEWLEALAKAEGCEVIVLDSYSQSHATHRFYFRAGFIIKGYHFYKEVVTG